MIFIVDNYDSFTYNLVQALGKIDPDVEVVRNDRFDPQSVVERRPTAIVISPGPGRPQEAGRSIEMIEAAERHAIPLLGVCLGHQAIGALHGGLVEKAPPRHGKSSRVTHDGEGVFAGLPNPFDAARYHSLVVREEGLPQSLVVTARSEDGLVMGLRHRIRPIHGVQFHPESVLTPEGEKLLANFLSIARKAGIGSPGSMARDEGKNR
jgi:anthranilate synthase/aminodeoxychorismate synthase-like glutamine amidotransferase